MIFRNGRWTWSLLKICSGNTQKFSERKRRRRELNMRSGFESRLKKENENRKSEEKFERRSSKRELKKESENRKSKEKFARGSARGSEKRKLKSDIKQRKHGKNPFATRALGFA